VSRCRPLRRQEEGIPSPASCPRQFGDRPIAPDRGQRHLRLERRVVLLPCPRHILLLRLRRFLGAGLHLSLLSLFRGPAHSSSRVTQNLRASPAGAGSRPRLSGDRRNGPRGRAGETQAPVHSKPALRSPSKRWSTSPGSAQVRRKFLAEDSRFASISLSSASAARASSILPSWPSPATT
jgi:hypothetical protein